MTDVGAQVPRIDVVPDGDEHPKWPQVLEMLDRVGMKLDEWQLRVLWASMLRRNDMWAAFTVGICCPRQNGKNEILQARELAGALVLDEELIIHSAHLADTCMEAFIRLDDMIDGNDWLTRQVKTIRRTNGREAVHFTNGARIRFRTRTRGGGRGFSGSPVIFDEPMFFPVISQNAILPVMTAQPDPQAWYTGSAVDQRDHEDGVVFARVRDRALRGQDDRLAYFEWSLDVEAPDKLDPDIAGDIEAWLATNPALGIRITPEYIKAEREELTPRGFAVERLGVGDWPDVDFSGDSPINLKLWNLLADRDAVAVGDEVLLVDVSPERATAIVSIGVTAAGKYLVEVVDSREGTGWVVARLEELCADRTVVDIGADDKGPSASLADEADAAGLSIHRFDSAEHAAACGQLIDFVKEEMLVHLGQAELAEAIHGAQTRPLVDSWAWSRKNSSVDIKTLVAMTLGLKLAVDREIANSELAIF